jgi:predicted nucleic acid-binding protein
MRILIDTDVLLDFALGRESFVSASQKVIVWAEANPGHAAIAWHSISNIAYLAPSGAREFLSELLRFVEVPTVRTMDAVRALQYPMRDIEDALQAAAAIAFKASYVISRNTKDYRQSPVPAITPKEFSLKLSKI